MPLGWSTIRASQLLASLIGPRSGNAEFTGKVRNRLSAGLVSRTALRLHYVEVL